MNKVSWHRCAMGLHFCVTMSVLHSYHRFCVALVSQCMCCFCVTVSKSLCLRCTQITVSVLLHSYYHICVALILLWKCCTQIIVSVLHSCHRVCVVSPYLCWSSITCICCTCVTVSVLYSCHRVCVLFVSLCLCCTCVTVSVLHSCHRVCDALLSPCLCWRMDVTGSGATVHCCAATDFSLVVYSNFSSSISTKWLLK